MPVLLPLEHDQPVHKRERADRLRRHAREQRAKLPAPACRAVRQGLKHPLVGADRYERMAVAQQAAEYHRVVHPRLREPAARRLATDHALLV